MADRKSGLDFFPVFTSLNPEVNPLHGAMIQVESEYGLTGFALIWKLLIHIYGGGYYCKWDARAIRSFTYAECRGVSNDDAREIVQFAIGEGIFDAGMYEKYEILTSEEIQQNYLHAVKKRVDNTISPEYDLIGIYPETVPQHSDAESVDSDAESIDSDAESPYSNSNSNSNSDSNSDSYSDSDSDIYIDSYNLSDGEIDSKKNNKKYCGNPSINQSIYPFIACDEIEQAVSAQVDEEYLLRNYNPNTVKACIDCICMVFRSKKSSMMINGGIIPAENVRKRFQKLTADDIGFVCTGIAESRSKVKNVQAYMLTALYNAPASGGVYWDKIVNADMEDGITACGNQ